MPFTIAVCAQCVVVHECAYVCVCVDWESAVAVCFSVSADAFTNLCEGRGQAQRCNPVLIISALPANLRDSGAKMADWMMVLEQRLESTHTLLCWRFSAQQLDVFMLISSSGNVANGCCYMVFANAVTLNYKCLS